eukprot:jgi/Bigna1/74920/fgenesh1_pg.31_\
MPLGGDSKEMSDHRFAHLLKPIKDLATNWNINVASELEEYMLTLEEIHTSFDGGKDLNFAEAALLIQGSAGVYSKKVEFLYSLIYQCLDIISKKTDYRKKKSSINKDGVDSDAFIQAEAEFLTLDDHMREAKNIDLKEINEDYKKMRQETLITRTPLSALNTKSLRKSNKGGVDYKVSECAVHASGALLYEERDSRLVDLSFRRDSMQASHLPFGSPATLLKSQAHEAKTSQGVNQENTDAVAKELAFPTHEQNQMDESFGDDGDCYDGDRDDYEQSDEKQEAKNAEYDEKNEEGENDTFALMDPYELEENIDPKKFKKGKCYRIIKATRRNIELVSREHKLIKLQVENQEAALTSIPDLSFSHFSGLLYQKLKIRHAERKRRSNLKERKMAVKQKQVEVVQDFAAHDEEGGFDPLSDEEFDVADIADIREDPLPSEGDALLADHENQISNAEGVFASPQELNHDSSSTFEDLCRKHVEAYVQAAQRYMSHSKLSQRVAAWQSKIEPHLQEMDSRPEFDIHRYGDQIVQRVQEKVEENENGTVPFSTVVSGLNQYEVSRNFLATLQLANHRRVDIYPSEEKGFTSIAVAVLVEQPEANDASKTMDSENISMEARDEIKTLRSDKVSGKENSVNLVDKEVEDGDIKRTKEEEPRKKRTRISKTKSLDEENRPGKNTIEKKKFGKKQTILFSTKGNQPIRKSRRGLRARRSINSLS